MVTDYQHINQLIHQPDKANANDMQLLDVVIDQYPWFQAARSIQLKVLYNQSSPIYNKQLQVAASHTTDRSILFDLITSPTFKHNQISEQIKQHQEPETQPDNTTIKAEDLNAVVNYNNTLDDDLFDKPKHPINQQPLQFNTNETHSFTEWLKLTKLQPIDRRVSTPKNTIKHDQKRKNKMAIIEQFLSDKPKIKPKKEKSPTPDIVTNPYQTNQLMTETLAQVYAAQHNYTKAIQAYKILVLQHPEKSGYFADRIKEIQKIQNNT